MATSGSVDFSVSRDNIITDALIIVGAVGPDDTVPTNWTTHAARQLNKIVKALGAKRIGLWARKVGYILPQSNVNEIDLGPSGDHATADFTVTQLAAAAASGASTISVDSATGISNTYNIGVELDDGTIDWTTVNGAPSGTTVTLTATLDGAASADNYVYVYQTKIVRPLRIVEAYKRVYSTASEYTEQEMFVVAKSEYEQFNNKLDEASPTCMAYEPLLTDGRVYLSSRFPDGDMVIKIIFQRPFEDFDASSDTPDFPQEWYDSLCYLLAVRLAPVYGMPSADRQLLRAEANEALMLALENEPEEGSFQISPTDGKY